MPRKDNPLHQEPTQSKPPPRVIIIIIRKKLINSWEIKRYINFITPVEERVKGKKRVQYIIDQGSHIKEKIISEM